MALDHAKAAMAVHLTNGSFLPEQKTAALVKTDRFEAVRIFVPAGGEIPKHKVSGFVTLQCVEGHVVIRLGKDVDLRSGEWMFLDRSAPHSLRGVEDSYLLLTILFE